MIALGGRLHAGYMVDAVDGFLSRLNVIARRVELAIPLSTFEERTFGFHGHGFERWRFVLPDFKVLRERL